VAGRTPTVELAEATSHPAPDAGTTTSAHDSTTSRSMTRRRRAMAIIGAVVAFVVIAVATLVVTASNSGSGRGHLTVSLPSAANSDIRVDMQNAHLSLRGHADASGSVTFDTTVEPGRYDVVVTVDRAGTPPVAGGVDIGSARVVYRAENVRIEEGRNTLRSDRLQQTS
jgi:hypothetical protein